MKITDVQYVDRILATEYARHPAPVVELAKAQTDDPFKILLATILSARTRDQTTAQAIERLFHKVTTPDDLRRLSVVQIEEMIFPVGFYHVKAKHLKQLPSYLKISK